MTLDDLPEPAKKKARATLANMPGFELTDITEEIALSGRSWVLHLSDPDGNPGGALIVFCSDAELKGQ
jgi:hypothetical protein